MTTLTQLPDARTPLSRENAALAFADILDARAEDEGVAAFLVTLADRGETSVEIAEAARALRTRMLAVDAPPGAIDVCGTGGDGRNTLNVSTAVALVVASCGVPVAKHGNRAATSRAGAADTLEALGLDLSRAGETLAEVGIAFLHAPHHHPALARLAPLRRRIARRTVFNLVGPLANPARVTRQLIGIARPDEASLYAEALEQLGTEAALVVSGAEGLDELSVAGPSTAVAVGAVPLAGPMTPEDAGLRRHPLDALTGGDAAHNAAALLALLDGEPGAYREAVLLNAAAALIVAGRETTLPVAAALAAEAIDTGAARDLLQRWIAA